MLIKQAVPSQSRALLPKGGELWGWRQGEGRMWWRRRGREGGGSEKEKFPLQVKTTGRYQRKKAVILCCVGKWRVSASRGRWGAQRDYQCRRTASLPYACRPSNNERLRCSPLLLWHFGVFIQWMLITKALEDELNLNRKDICLGEAFKQQTWIKGLFEYAFWGMKSHYWYVMCM